MKGIKYIKWIFVLAVVMSLTACNSLKVTDPADPRFDPMKFKISDYNEESFAGAIKKLFPEGTDVSRVDSILVDTGKASKSDVVRKSGNAIRYDFVRFLGVYPGASATSFFTITQDDQGKLKEVVAVSY